MPQSGEKLPKGNDDEFGPRIVETMDEMPTAGMSSQQFKQAIRTLYSNRDKPVLKQPK